MRTGASILTTLHIRCMLIVIWSPFRNFSKKCSFNHSCIIKLFQRNASPLCKKMQTYNLVKQLLLLLFSFIICMSWFKIAINKQTIPCQYEQHLCCVVSYFQLHLCAMNFLASTKNFFSVRRMTSKPSRGRRTKNFII